MRTSAPWIARAWLPYSLTGIGWVMVGSFALGVPRGLGLIIIGLSCLSIGMSGVLWRVRQGYGLVRDLPLNRTERQPVQQ